MTSRGNICVISLCRALQQVVKYCSGFEPHLNSDLLQLVFTCVGHTNRFARETGYRVIAAFISHSLHTTKSEGLDILSFFSEKLAIVHDC